MKKNHFVNLIVAFYLLLPTAGFTAGNGVVSRPTLSSTPAAAPIVISASGAAAANIQPAVDDFRSRLGANNGIGGAFPSGRREINWDGVPDNFAAPNNLPPDFFNNNSKRGAVFGGAGSGFQVSAKTGNPTSTALRFGHINNTYPANFTTFSAERLFTTIDSNVYDIFFFIPGTNQPALVRGFGVVFTDVETAESTKIEYFNGARSLGIFDVPPSSNAGLSFVGVDFEIPTITHVRITSGQAALGPGVNDLTDYGDNDLVVMDDFIYGEPAPRLFLHLPFIRVGNGGG